MYVLCPICKVGSVKETSSPGCFPALSCACGFAFQTTQEPLHGALADFQERVATAYMAHRCVGVSRDACAVTPSDAFACLLHTRRERCGADPSFEKTSALGPSGAYDAIRLVCPECHACHELQ